MTHVAPLDLPMAEVSPRGRVRKSVSKVETEKLPTEITQQIFEEICGCFEVLDTIRNFDKPAALPKDARSALERLRVLVLRDKDIRTFEELRSFFRRRNQNRFHQETFWSAVSTSYGRKHKKEDLPQ
jgi:hypothetical protein